VKKEIDNPIPRPETVGAARSLIAQIFRENNWSERDIKVYCSMIGIEYSDRFGADDTRRILEDLERSRMILFL
jgi:hypothetical protein